MDTIKSYIKTLSQLITLKERDDGKKEQDNGVAIRLREYLRHA